MYFLPFLRYTNLAAMELPSPTFSVAPKTSLLNKYRTCLVLVRVVVQQVVVMLRLGKWANLECPEYLVNRDLECLLVQSAPWVGRWEPEDLVVSLFFRRAVSCNR